MPDDTDMAFVLIQHLDPTHESLTAELLGKHTRMSVVQVTDEMRVEPNHVYVIPPKKYLTISGETLQLTEQVERRGVRVPIDFFFRSLADDQQERAIGIILSGTGSDGTLGVREIKAAGGMVMVQDARIRPVRRHAAQRHRRGRGGLRAAGRQDARRADPLRAALVRQRRGAEEADRPICRSSTTDAGQLGPSRDDLTTIIGLLRARVKYDFSCYKKGTLTRRVQRRMGLKHVDGDGRVRRNAAAETRTR